jgi:hypothetical protein
MSTRREELRQELCNAEGVRPRGPRPAETTLGRYDRIYVAWFEAESECQQALRKWFERARSDRVRSDRDGTYTTYRAALDREEAAARDLERLCRPGQA